MLIILIILNLFWSGAAWIYDASKLITLSPFIWPFVAVCPIFPLLLALVLVQLYRKKLPNQFLLAFAAIPSALYGVIAIFYYPVAMIYQGFSWNALGQIFWVLFYAIQGFYLIKKYKINKELFALVLGLLVVQFVVIDIIYKSFGYFDFSGISNLIIILIISISLVIFISILDIFHQKS